jgi:hypothetical protein
MGDADSVQRAVEELELDEVRTGLWQPSRHP